MRELSDWFDAHTAAAPDRLRARARRYAVAAEEEGPTRAHALAAAGAAALDTVTAHAGDRSAALDLLAADALITLALLEQAERDPAGLGELAADLLRRHGPAS